MKGMEKITVAQEKADHFCAPLENPAGLRIRAESPDAGWPQVRAHVFPGSPES